MLQRYCVYVPYYIRYCTRYDNHVCFRLICIKIGSGTRSVFIKKHFSFSYELSNFPDFLATNILLFQPNHRLYSLRAIVRRDFDSFFGHVIPYYTQSCSTVFRVTNKQFWLSCAIGRLLPVLLSNELTNKYDSIQMGLYST